MTGEISLKHRIRTIYDKLCLSEQLNFIIYICTIFTDHCQTCRISKMLILFIFGFSQSVQLFTLYHSFFLILVEDEHRKKDKQSEYFIYIA